MPDYTLFFRKRIQHHSRGSGCRSPLHPQVRAIGIGVRPLFPCLPAEPDWPSPWRSGLRGDCLRRGRSPRCFPTTFNSAAWAVRWYRFGQSDRLGPLPLAVLRGIVPRTLTSPPTVNFSEEDRRCHDDESASWLMSLPPRQVGPCSQQTAWCSMSGPLACFGEKETGDAEELQSS